MHQRLFRGILASLSVLLISNFGFSQEPAGKGIYETSIKRHNVGAAAGFISGYGLSYRHWGESKNGYQVTFVPIASKDESGMFVNISAGGMGLRSLHQARRTNAFAYYGGQYNFTSDENRESYSSGSSNSYEETVHNLSVGAGVGVEIHFWNLNYSLMFGYSWRGRQESRSGSVPYDLPGESQSWGTSPSVETGFFYCF